MRLGNYDALWLLFAIPLVLVPLQVWGAWRRRRMLARLIDAPLLGRVNDTVSGQRRLFKAILVIVAFAAIVIALTRPAWNPRPRSVRHRGRDVVILLDVSRSMLAEDLRPNRLERAKLAIRDLADRLVGDRLAIVTFAGDATIRCPLTRDVAFVRMVLDTINTESTTLGGTNVGDAIRMALDKLFEDTRGAYRDIILITDGEDHGSEPVAAAAKAGQQGVRLIAVGLGNPDQGARIPVYDEQGRRTGTYLKHEGREVWSKLDAETLRQMAAATPGGVYIGVETGTLDLGQIYESLVRSAEKTSLEATMVMQYDERFQVFLVLAIALLTWEAMLSERRTT